MSNIRMLNKDGLLKNDEFVKALGARGIIFYQVLFTEAENHGSILYDPRNLARAGLAMRYSVKEIEKYVRILEDMGKIIRYEVEGKIYFYIRSFLEHQKGLNKSPKPKIPCPEWIDVSDYVDGNGGKRFTFRIRAGVCPEVDENLQTSYGYDPDNPPSEHPVVIPNRGKISSARKKSGASHSGRRVVEETPDSPKSEAADNKGGKTELSSHCSDNDQALTIRYGNRIRKEEEENDLTGSDPTVGVGRVNLAVDPQNALSKETISKDSHLATQPVDEDGNLMPEERSTPEEVERVMQEVYKHLDVAAKVLEDMRWRSVDPPGNALSRYDIRNTARDCLIEMVIAKETITEDSFREYFWPWFGEVGAGDHTLFRVPEPVKEIDFLNAGKRDDAKPEEQDSQGKTDGRVEDDPDIPQ